MAQYAYDEQGFNFYYFLISVLSLALVPVSLQSLYSLYKSSASSNKNVCQCQTCQQERKKNSVNKPSVVKNLLTSPKFLFLVIGWVGVVLLAMQVANAEVKTATWDPYEILGIREGATLSEIKKTFKKLSLIYHPDKAKAGEEEKNEERFIDITKAYKVLTDEDTRRNYEEFGHPDGKQSFTMGVALPKGLVEGNGMLVLCFYAIAFGLGLPYSIAQWWYRSRRLTKDKILNKTMGLFVKGFKESDGFKDIIQVLSSAIEFKEGINTSDEKALKSINSAIAEELENRLGEKFDRLADTLPAYQRKARTLIYAHLLRIDLLAKGADRSTVKDQKFIVDKSIHLLQGLLQIATVKQWLSSSCELMELQQHFLQATYPGEPSARQLPHIQPSLLRRFNRNRKTPVHNVQQIYDLPEEERKQLLKPLNEQEYLDVMEVAARIPKLTVQKAVFKVIGDNIITTGAIITFILKLKNGKVVDVDVTSETKKEEEEEEDEALIQPDDEKNKSGKVLPMAHTPYYAGEKKPCWWIFLGDPKVNRILVPHKKVTDIVDEQTIKIPFPGPPKPGVYTFSLFVKSDTYVGTDILQDVKLHVQDPADLPEEEEVDDSISEPEEDSIAGQMKLMREQGFASALAGGSSKDKHAQQDSDSDSSSSEDEEDDANYVTESDSD
ncbi:Translocation protein sec63 [Choanephora cucurbitarum]|uniref:Translocation protein sec63 n=1 Tax=Choanephora cucurbitarum TaxID=101091 RepID=A0A1C7NS68_9FUNG|nr:Translocation protein sec63 [Choanephora cucurbitarum]